MHCVEGMEMPSCTCSYIQWSDEHHLGCYYLKKAMGTHGQEYEWQEAEMIKIDCGRVQHVMWN